MIGISMPVPIACIRRPDRSTGNVGAIAQMAVPTVNMIIVPRNSCLVVNHWISRAETGMTMPMTSMKPVAIHRTVGSVISNSCIRVVSAIFNSVSFRMAKNAPMISDSMIGSVFTFWFSDKYSYVVVFFISVSSFL